MGNNNGPRSFGKVATRGQADNSARRRALRPATTAEGASAAPTGYSLAATVVTTLSTADRCRGVKSVDHRVTTMRAAVRSGRQWRHSAPICDAETHPMVVPRSEYQTVGRGRSTHGHGCGDSPWRPAQEATDPRHPAERNPDKRAEWPARTPRFPLLRPAAVACLPLRAPPRVPPRQR